MASVTKEAQMVKKRRVDDGEYQEIADLAEKVREMESKRNFFIAENENLKNQIVDLTGEIQGVSVALASAEKQIASQEVRLQKSLNNIERLALTKEAMEQEVNTLRLRLKAVQEHLISSSEIRSTMMTELNELNSERGIIIKRLKGIEKGIQEISTDKERVWPKVKKYDDVLKQIYHLFLEAQNRMEVSVILKQK